MDLKTYKTQFAGMTSAQVREAVTANAAFKSATADIYREVFRTSLNTACPDCYFDAYLRIMTTKESIMNSLAERRFVLKAGAVLEDVAGHDPALLVNRHTCTDEIALYHLRTCPDYIRLFETFPDDWETLARESDPAVKAAKKAAQTPARSERANGQPATESAPEAAKTAENANKSTTSNRPSHKKAKTKRR